MPSSAVIPFKVPDHRAGQDLFVAFADLIPLVGATLGAIVAIGVAALHSLPAALVVLVFFVLYQQADNHLLQPVMSRTVQLSALTVTIAILLGAELLGFLGALLASPVTGILHVIGRDLYDSYRGRPKPEPTIGQDEVPVSAPDAPDRASEPPRTVTAVDGGGAGRRLGDGTGHSPRRGT